MASVTKREWTSKTTGEKKSAWTVRYKHDGKHCSKKFEKKHDADRFRSQVETEIERGTHIADRQTMTLEKATESYLAQCEIRFRQGKIGRTHLWHQHHYLRKHLPRWLRAKLLTSIRWTDVERLNSELIRESGLKPTTVRKFLVIVRSVFQLALLRDCIHRNPVEEFLKHEGGLRTDPVRTFTVEDVILLIEGCAVKTTKQHVRVNKMMELYVHLAACCGLRHGEISALKWEKIDLDRLVIHVHYNLTKWDELKTPKSEAGYRSVLIPAHIKLMLIEWRRYAVVDKRGLIFRAATGYGPNGSGVREGLWEAGNFGRVWHALLERSGLSEPDDKGRALRFHSLRHFASSMMAVSTPIADVAAALGHRHFDTTLRIYTHALKPGLKAPGAAEAIASAIVPRLGIAHRLRTDTQDAEIVH